MLDGQDFAICHTYYFSSLWFSSCDTAEAAACEAVALLCKRTTAHADDIQLQRALGLSGPSQRPTTGRSATGAGQAIAKAPLTHLGRTRLWLVWRTRVSSSARDRASQPALARPRFVAKAALPKGRAAQPWTRWRGWNRWPAAHHGSLALWWLAVSERADRHGQSGSARAWTPPVSTQRSVKLGLTPHARRPGLR